MLLRKGSLDRYSLSGLHGANGIEILVFVSVLPNPLSQKAGRLIVCAPIAGTHKPISVRVGICHGRRSGCR